MASNIELNLDSSTEIIKSVNSTIFFKLRKKKVILKETKKPCIIDEGENIVTINNISSNYVALRVRTTKRKNYTVKPNYAIINPNSLVNIKIYYHSIPNEQISFLGHKFKFEGFIIEEKDKNCQNILDLFHQVIQSKKIVKGNFIEKNVKFLLQDNNTQMNDKLTDNKLIQVKKECDETRKEYEKLYNELNVIKKENIINVKDYFNVGKELIIKIKENKIYLGLMAALFSISIIFGFYINK